jgi:type IX secretion system PorP/SprF family membrane protein
VRVTSQILSRLILSLLILSIFQAAKAQQLFSYSQYMNNLTPLNPAYSVIDKTGSLNGVFRKQWTGVDGAPSTFIVNGNLPIESVGGTAGLTVLNDQFAVEHLTEINLFFAKSIQLAANQHLAVSLNGGIRRYVAGYSSLDPVDPQFKDDVRESKPNIGFGVLYYTDHYYLGVAVPEFTTRSLGNASLVDNGYFRSHYNFSGAYLFGKPGDEVRAKPAVLATYTQGTPLIADFSTTLYLKEILGIGGNYRSNNEMSGVLSVNMESFKLGYSYQFGTASNNVARGFKNNTHEITLTYRFGSNLAQRSLL